MREIALYKNRYFPVWEWISPGVQVNIAPHVRTELHFSYNCQCAEGQFRLLTSQVT